ncbi:MAG: glycosyltransferase [Humidesulfovibrio sp.]|nr:glycosyltransferase [Humidesulfovibrio sp.]
MHSNPLPRVCFVIAHLGLGGAQRALTDMVNRWAACGTLRPVVLVLGDESVPAFPLTPGVSLRWLGLSGDSNSAAAKLANNVRRVSGLRKAILAARPDVVVAFQDTTSVLTLLACLGTGLPVVASERTDPAFHHIGAVWSALRVLTYPLAAAVAVQTEAARKALPWPARRKAQVIPNAVFTSKTCGDVTPLPRPLVVSLGRFSPEKGFPELLQAFALAAATRSEWLLVLLGDGPQRTELVTLGQALGLADRLHLPGVVDNVPAWMAQAELFVLASHYEGFPNALCEALACGLPAIATATTGAATVIRQGIDGLLVPVKDVSALAEALGRLMDDEGLRRAMALRATEILTRYDPERIMGLWDRLLGQAMAEQSVKRHK